MSSRSADWIYTNVGDFLIKIQFKKGVLDLQPWIYFKFDDFFIKNQLNNELEICTLDLYQIQWFLNLGLNKQWAPDLQTGAISNLMIFELRITCRMASRSIDWIYIKFVDFLIKNKCRMGSRSADGQQGSLPVSGEPCLWWSHCVWVWTFHRHRHRHVSETHAR